MIGFFFFFFSFFFFIQSLKCKPIDAAVTSHSDYDYSGSPTTYLKQYYYVR